MDPKQESDYIKQNRCASCETITPPTRQSVAWLPLTEPLERRNTYPSSSTCCSLCSLARSKLNQETHRRDSDLRHVIGHTVLLGRIGVEIESRMHSLEQLDSSGKGHSSSDIRENTAVEQRVRQDGDKSSSDIYKPESHQVEQHCYTKEKPQFDYSLKDDDDETALEFEDEDEDDDNAELSLCRSMSHEVHSDSRHR